MGEEELKEEIRVMSNKRSATRFNTSGSKEDDTGSSPRVIEFNVRGRIFDVSSETLSQVEFI